MSQQQPPPRSNTDMGKVATAFIAGTLFGVFSAVGIAPNTGAPLAAGQGFPVDQNGAVTADQLGGTGDASGADGGLAAGAESQAGDPFATAGGVDTTGGPTVAAGGDPGPATGGGTAGGSGPAGTSGGGVSFGGGGGGGSSGSQGGASGGGGGGASGSGGGGGGTGSGCAANNGGATDVGVTGNEIQVASTVVLDGPGASLLEPAGVGMQSVIDQVNRAGGVCGRRIALETRNDSWDAARGRDFIRRFIEANKFALLVVPSSEGLAESIKAGDISRAGIPVVGTTGLRIDEYKDPWVFPVSTATVSIMRIIADHALKNGASSFGIVWDSKYKFGLEGANAFKEYVKSKGGTVKADIPIDPDKPSYGTEATQFNQACGNTGSSAGCDAVVLLLVPETALKWKSANSGDVAGRGKTTYGAQTLFADDFATKCKDWCDGMKVWTGYNPPIPPVDNQADVKAYISAVRQIRPSIDYRNQFVEGAFLGARVFVEALEACSPNLTRACVKQTLDQITYQSGLSSPLAWRPGKHHANVTAQAFSMEASGGSFNGWRYENTGFIRDPAF